MGIKVRTKELSNGRLSIFLDYYPPIKGPNGKLTRREFLKRYNLKHPKNQDEKRLNRENMFFADTVRLAREKDMLNEQNGLYNSRNNTKDFIEYFRILCEDRMESDGNYGNWLSTLRYLIAFTSDTCKMSDINEEFCNKFKDYLLKANRLNTVKGLKLSQNSALSYFNKFRCAVNEAYDARLINENPLRRVKGIKQKETKREFLTQEELQLLVNTECELEALKKAALFSALTGLRWSDIKSLKWEDIQKTGSGYFLHLIQQKTDDVMMHPINEKAVILLGEAGEPKENVFEGLKYSDSNNHKLKLWVLKAGINKKIGLHNFRHTYATLMLNKGVDIFTVSKMLGHKNIKTTLIYSKVLTETKVNAANLIDFDL
ncbi:MAG: hypothetical protein A3K10_09850 [Bacteroidetes bacterium RIFCSPLOWO2_12_FULL_31_6]|nr:MAG: hypothetical protein A3K10_09850 [Bacteroidetes bacterium RIFCSPLOWO2_12_FULL_31_6]